MRLAAFRYFCRGRCPPSSRGTNDDLCTRNYIVGAIHESPVQARRRTAASSYYAVGTLVLGRPNPIDHRRTCPPLSRGNKRGGCAGITECIPSRWCVHGTGDPSPTATAAPESARVGFPDPCRWRPRFLSCRWCLHLRVYIMLLWLTNDVRSYIDLKF